MKKAVLAAIFFAAFATTATAQTAKSETANPGTAPTVSQCQAKTAKGHQCRNKAKMLGLCGVHSAMADTANQCGAKTKAGAPCKRRVLATGKKCHHHSN